MNATYHPQVCLIRGKMVDLGGWYWDSDGSLVSDDELCEACGKPTKETYRDDCQICEPCNIDKEAARIDALHDREMMK